MLPIEVVLGLLWLIFGFVGVVRRFPVELGATILFVGMLLGLELVGNRMGSAAVKVADAAGTSFDADLMHWLAYIGVIVASVAMTYQGQTLSFPGYWPPNRVVGWSLDLLVGLLNGWIVLGSCWHFTAQYQAALQQVGLLQPPVSSLATMLLEWTPQSLLPDSPGSVYILAVCLLFLFVLRVAR